jgi:hypothetical protein
MISGLNLNQPVNVALTGLMFRNSGCNSSFVYGHIFQTICALDPGHFIPSSEANIVQTHLLKMSILAGSGLFWQAFYPNP